MKKFIRLFMIGFWILPLGLSPGHSWGNDAKPDGRTVSSGKSFTADFKEKAKEEIKEIKEGTKKTGQDIKESAGDLPKKAREEFKKTGKAVKETGKEIRNKLKENWKDLKKLFKD